MTIMLFDKIICPKCTSNKVSKYPSIIAENCVDCCCNSCNYRWLEKTTI